MPQRGVVALAQAEASPPPSSVRRGAQVRTLRRLRAAYVVGAESTYVRYTHVAACVRIYIHRHA